MSFLACVVCLVGVHATQTADECVSFLQSQEKALDAVKTVKYWNDLYTPVKKLVDFLDERREKNEASVPSDDPSIREKIEKYRRAVTRGYLFHMLDSLGFEHMNHDDRVKTVDEFGRSDLARIALNTLAFDRQNCVLNMQYVRPGDKFGMIWAGKGAFEQKLSCAIKEHQEFVTKSGGRPTINKRYFWLLDALDDGSSDVEAFKSLVEPVAPSWMTMSSASA